MRSIELKILLPFLFILVIAIATVGITSYVGSSRILHDLMSKFPASSSHINEDFVTQRLFDLQKYTILVAIIAILASCQLTIFFTYSIAMPIKKFVAACNELANGNFNIEVKYKSNDEIGILRDAFNTMAKKLKSYIDDVLRLKELNQKILNGINYGIVLFSNDHTVLFTNNTANKLFKSSPLLAEWVNNFIENYENTVIPPKGVIKWPPQESNFRYIEYEITPAGENYILCFSDITEEEKLKQNMEHINRLVFIGEMSAALAHEIRNPLQGIQACFQVLESSFPNEEDETKSELYRAIYREIDRINRIITNLLQFARPSDPIPEKVSFARIMNEIKPFITSLLKEKALKLQCSIPEYDELYIDPNHLKQILMNLITNAIRASKNGGSINISLSLTQDDEVILCIKDEGIGIPAQNLNKIFTPFFTTFPGGNGLGLCVVQSLTLKNRGRIWIESTENRGTSVYLAFPAYLHNHTFARR
ncbi:Sporulation kinase E [Fervidicola ferrireducens]|uniref:histidine kinase n=1 Tax=Fervidicola ferrireducens TaxID=520764 RepID=A0A140L1T3_9FIRM|nr:HAMP domain-containing sensor histidine kinase [Fervidicola ferrireducens]KXG74508.1 Sporulation kinase E [Fervidicola ferrireducens]